MADNAILDETKQKLNEVDSRIEILKEQVQFADDLESLHQDERFKRVILDGYIDREAQRLFGLLTDPTHYLKRDVMENIMDKLTSIRNFQQYFGTIMTNATMAPEQIEEEEVYRKSITASKSITDNKDS